MDTRDVLLVDVFADAPMTGTPIGVVLAAQDLSTDQRDAIAAEFGAPATAFVSTTADGPTVQVAGERAGGPDPPVAIAAATALEDRGRLPADDVSLEVSDRDVAVTIEPDGRLWVDVDAPDLREADVSAGEVADAIGVDVAAIRDVGADLPLVRASLGRGVLLVPVNFLEHLSGASPDPDAIGELLDATSAESIYAFTFDTLGADSDVHALAVGRDGARTAATGEAAACAVAALRRYGAVDHDRTDLHVEEGDIQDRPARIGVRIDDAGGRASVGGRAVTALDGTIVVPPAGDGDDIIEA